MDSIQDLYDDFMAALNFYLNKEGWGGQSSLSAASDLSDSAISQILSGKRKASLESQIKIANGCKVNFLDFLKLGRSLIETGRPPEPSTPESYLIVQVSNQSDKDILNGFADDYRGIPLYESGKLAAGVNGVTFDPHETPSSMVVVYKPELKGCSKHNLAALKVGGVSMEPTIIAGSIVVVDLSDKEFFDGKVFVVNTPEGGVDIASVKRVRKWDNGFLLYSDNHKYPPVPTRLDWDLLCVGRVVWMWRDIRDV